LSAAPLQRTLDLAPDVALGARSSVR